MAIAQVKEAALSVRLVKATLRDGEPLFFEQDEPPGGPVREVGVGDVIEELDFEAALRTLKGAVAQIGEAMRGLPQPPATCEVTFGVKLSVGTGVILAKAGAEGNFSITLCWSSAAP